MAEVIPVTQLISLSRSLKKQNKKTVLVGGCFDILHPGHVIFLEKAKKTGDILIVFLESDKKVKILKGEKRPIHTQKMRGLILASLTSVDYVVMLTFMQSDASYIDLVQKMKPDIIAVTSGYEVDYHKRAAKLSGARLKYVTSKVGNYSSSKILGIKDEN